MTRTSTCNPYKVHTLRNDSPIHCTTRFSAPPLRPVSPRELDTPAEPTLEPPVRREHKPRRELETESLAESLEELTPAGEIAAETAREAV
jgi:hypothetical protein